MKCIIAGGNVKVLGRAVHSLSRIGDELYLEPTDGGSFLGIFRSLPSLEKTVEKCLILLRPRASRLVVQLHCKYGVTKTHNLAFQECERLQAVFDTQRCASQLCAPARVLAEAVVHFPPTLAEVTLGAGPGGKLSLRNYVEDETELKKTMVTELWLAEDEFQMVAVVPGSHITFCLKEFRGLLTFAEASNLPLTIHYDVPGRPVVFTLDDAVLEVHLVLATLSDTESNLQPPPTNGVSHPPAPSDDFADDLESYMIAMETSAYEEGSGAPPSPTFPLRTPHPAESDPEEEEEEEEGAVPGTPPHKKFCSLFFGSVLMPRGPSLAPTQEVLAEDSDNEY
ncbi:cell cycle checkpoint control protein RAD9A isoform X2 [Falco cherrug]|uniref:cell cycle checkpoint control protein RAD9A isoform X2 n=1 Tax=Falco cherrug TaxID=345164 RepID=UPI000FFC1FDE|nr:cell cycle checkpoint control protein RAD9A isoform X2 [Falco cherrug]